MCSLVRNSPLVLPMDSLGFSLASARAGVPAVHSGERMGGGLQTQGELCPGQGLRENPRGGPVTPAEAGEPSGSQQPGGELGALQEVFGVSGAPLGP